MKKLILLILLCLCIISNLLAQDISSLKNEYSELLWDIWIYGPQATIPYYTDSEYYHRSDRYIVDVDDDFVFAIIGSGFVKFVDEQGNVKYSRYLWLHKDAEGYLCGAAGRYIDEFYEVDEADEAGYYWMTAYLPKPESKIIRNYMTIEMDEVIPVERVVISRKLNTTLVDLLYTVNRMMEILYHLKYLQPEPFQLYEYKIRILEMLLNYVIDDMYEVDQKYRTILADNQKVTQDTFIEIHKHLQLIRNMLPFLKLDR